MGVLGMDCECLAQDVEKLFAVYWNLTSPTSHVPNPWPPAYDAMFNLSQPAQLSLNGTPALAYWSVSQGFLFQSGCDYSTWLSFETNFHFHIIILLLILFAYSPPHLSSVPSTALQT